MANSTKAEDGTWTFTCPGVIDSLCGDPHSDITFTSAGWPTKTIADARGQQHFDDHKGTPAPDLDAFRNEHGLVAHPNGIHAVRIEDLP